MRVLPSRAMTNDPHRPSRFGLPRSGGAQGGGEGQPPAPGDGGEVFWDNEPTEDITLSIKGARARESNESGWLEIDLDTTRGLITLLMAAYEGGTGVAIFLAGAGGGDRGPANEIFVRLGNDLAANGVSAIRVKYREPGEFEECVADAMAALSFLKAVGAERVVLVGYSFGGAVAVQAGELSPLTTAVCSMSTQRYGTFGVEDLGKPLLLLHGSRDDVLDKAASEDVYERAREPKEIIILQGAGHGLQESEEDVFKLVKRFVTEHVAVSGS